MIAQGTPLTVQRFSCQQGTGSGVNGDTGYDAGTQFLRIIFDNFR